MKTPLFQVSAPGRICLFGEHSDYLGLPVMTMAIDLRMKISATPRRDKKFRILMPDIGEEDAFVPSRALKYQKPRDYLRAGVNVLKRRGFQFQKGFDFEIRSDIPVNAGASSSSALVIAWLKMLLTVEQSSLMWNALEIAKMGFETDSSISPSTAGHKLSCIPFSPPRFLLSLLVYYTEILDFSTSTKS